MSLLEDLGLMDELPWFKMKRWLYHVIKIMTGATLTFILEKCGLSIMEASVVGMILPVLFTHILYEAIGKYPFNLKDTIFDLLLYTFSFNFVIVYNWGWACGIAGLVLYSVLGTLMLRNRWNSP